MDVFDIGGYRVIDLSKKLYPSKETRRLAIRRYTSEPMKDYHSEIDIMSHLGTHVESPYHFSSGWKDILELPLSAYMGRCVLLYMKDIDPCAPITGYDLDKADKGRIRKGDIALLNTPYTLEPFTDKSNTDEDLRPFVCKQTALWLAEKEIKAVAFGDTVSIESSKEDVYDFHDILMKKDVVFIEVVKNVDRLRADIFFLIYMPLPISGLDSCPARVVAIEGIPGFC
jgi:arylformamidase